MKGLLYKDIRLAWVRAKMLILAPLLCIGCAAVLPDSNSFFPLYGSFLLGMLPSTLLGLEERDGWQSYVRTLPVSGAQVVSTKYILGLLAAAAGTVATAFVLLCRAGYLPLQSRLTMLALASACSLLNSMILLPLTYRFGSQKAGIFSMIAAGVLCGTCYLFYSRQDGYLGSYADMITNRNPFALLLLGLLGGAAALYALSWRLSVAWYNKGDQK